MLSLDLSHFKKLRNIDTLTELPSIKQFLPTIQTPIHEAPGYLDLPQQDIEKITSLAGHFEHKKHIVIAGLGGSSLGPKTITQALGHTSDKKVWFADNIDPFLLEQIKQGIEIDSTVFLIITKSGQTPETISLFYYFKKLIETAGHSPQEHCILITDPHKGHLRKLIQSEGYSSLEIPENVGGRFSVLTPVGLLLSGLLGLNIEDMLRGAADIKEQSTQSETDHNLAFNLAALQYHEYQDGKPVHVIMSYSDQLSLMADWCTQLYGESLGKINKDGQSVGFTPHPARGVSDQHSQLQLFKEGPNDKCYIFLKPKNDTHIKIPTITEESLSYLSNISFNELMGAEFNATKQSLVESDRPLVEISLDKVDEYHLGALFMLFQITTSYLGFMMNVNTYDQPGVERSKILTKEYLSGGLFNEQV